MSYRGKNLFTGQVFLTYLGLYGLGRVLIEGLRTDQLKVGPVAVSQVLSGVLVILCFGLILRRRKHR